MKIDGKGNDLVSEWANILGAKTFVFFGNFRESFFLWNSRSSKRESFFKTHKIRKIIKTGQFISTLIVVNITLGVFLSASISLILNSWKFFPLKYQRNKERQPQNIEKSYSRENNFLKRSLLELTKIIQSDKNYPKHTFFPW